MAGDAEPVPTPQVCKQSVRQAHRRLSLFGFAYTLRPPVKDTAIKIDITAPDGGLECRATDRGVSGACVEAGQNKSRDVFADIAFRVRALHHLLRTPRRPQQLRRLIACQPITPRADFCGSTTEITCEQRFSPM